MQKAQKKLVVKKIVFTTEEILELMKKTKIKIATKKTYK